jgi:hypothetical protein
MGKSDGSPPPVNIVRPLAGSDRGAERREYVAFRRPSFTSATAGTPAQMQRQLTSFAREVEKATAAARTVPPFYLIEDVEFTAPFTIVEHGVGARYTSWAFERIRVGVAAAYEEDNDPSEEVREILDRKQITFAVATDFTANLKVYF